MVAVVVAYNRRELLGETLTALLEQTHAPRAIVVVDNGSDDGSADHAAQLAPDADIVRLPRNTGGAGGFAVGIERAVTVHSADLVWVMDDDTVPTASALEELLAARTATGKRAGAYGSRVVWTDGRDHPMNTPKPSPFRWGAARALRVPAAAVDAFPVRSSSFVSLLLEADIVRERGLPIADYFLWNDDFEYSGRIVRGSTALFCRRSVVVHKTKVFGSTKADPGERFYLEVRNKLWLFLRSRAYSPFEKAVYVSTTSVRWALTFAGSHQRAVLRSGLIRGLRDGLTTRPRPNAETLADLGAVGAAIAAFEGAL
ncbi:glycosyltransferase [Naasia lichenicola]|uniref:Glycosyltransferase n=1 Tax=Naasia lichenicola TaxID=2565933 RepID=A0A4S4FL30_9MICO|nr:glycosyltransferase [Naasia lichenicola]